MSPCVTSVAAEGVALDGHCATFERRERASV